MWNRALAFFLFFSIFCCLHASDFQRRFFVKRNAVDSKKFVAEKECSKAGGHCLAREECPADKISKQGRCPTQSGAGAVCCHSVSINEKKCRNLGGMCRTKCRDILKLTQAEDCPEAHTCCALVV